MLPSATFGAAKHILKYSVALASIFSNIELHGHSIILALEQQFYTHSPNCLPILHEPKNCPYPTSQVLHLVTPKKKNNKY